MLDRETRALTIPDVARVTMKEAGSGREQPTKVWQPWDQGDDSKRSSESSSSGDSKRRPESPLSLVAKESKGGKFPLRNRILEPLGRHTWSNSQLREAEFGKHDRPIYGEASSSTSVAAAVTWPPSIPHPLDASSLDPSHGLPVGIKRPIPCVPLPPYLSRAVGHDDPNLSIHDADVPLDMSKKSRTASPPPPPPLVASSSSSLSSSPGPPGPSGDPPLGVPRPSVIGCTPAVIVPPPHLGLPAGHTVTSSTSGRTPTATPSPPAAVVARVPVAPPPSYHSHHHSDLRRGRITNDKSGAEVSSMTGNSNAAKRSQNVAKDSRKENASRTVSSIVGSSDPVIDEHFRRSLGKSYHNLFSPPAISSTSESSASAPFPASTTAASSSSVSSSSSNRSSPTSSVTGMSVDDHFAKALGETWLRLQAESSDRRIPASSVSPGSGDKPCSPSESLTSTSVDSKNLIST